MFREDGRLILNYNEDEDYFVPEETSFSVMYNNIRFSVFGRQRGKMMTMYMTKRIESTPSWIVTKNLGKYGTVSADDIIASIRAIYDEVENFELRCMSKDELIEECVRLQELVYDR